MAQTITREPIELCSGDTLSFTRTLSNYLPSAGWSLKYELRGGNQVIEFVSTASGSSHLISVPAIDTANWISGEYVLFGYAINGAQRNQIYEGSVTINLDAPASLGNVPVKTFAQKMVEALEAQLLVVTAGGVGLKSSRIGETMFEYQTYEELNRMHGYWVGVRANEIKRERAKMGLPTGNKIRPVMRVTNTGFPGYAGIGYNSLFGR